MKTLFAPVQTNTALYCQMHEAGYPCEVILRARETYRTCRLLFNDRYRKTERPFLCHAVGAASAMVQFDPRPEYALAAMLHAAYDSGVFSDGRFGPTEAHRAWLRGQAGEVVESIVFAYNRFSFEKGAPERIVAEGIPEADRDLLLLALAHEIDDLADGGLVFAPKYGKEIGDRIDACRILADQLGHSELAQTFCRYGEKAGTFGWAEGLAGVTDLTGIRIAPNWRSYLRLRRHARKGQVKIF